MALKLYLDDCAYSRSLRDLLRAAGHTVVTPADAGLTGQDDPVHLAFAKGNDLLVITKNPADFESLHQADNAHPGILAIYLDNDVTRDMTDEEVVAAIHSLERAFVKGTLAGGFHVLNQWRGAPASPTPRGASKKRRPRK